MRLGEREEAAVRNATRSATSPVQTGACAMAVAASLLAAYAGITQTASTAADPMRVARASTQLVVGIERHDCGGYHLYAFAGDRRRLLSSHRAACSPSLAPDGLHVAYLAYDREVPTLFVEKLDGSSRQAIAACAFSACDLPSRFLSYAWSPAGDRLVYATRDADRSHLRMADLTGKVLADLTPRGSKPTTVFADPTWSPRGGWITVVKAYWEESISTRLAQEVDIVGANGRNWRRLFRTVYERQHMYWPSFAWAPDGRRLAVEDASHYPAMPYAVFAPNGRRLVSSNCARGPAYCPRDLSWSPSSRRIAWVNAVNGRELIVATPDVKSIRRIKIRARGDFSGPEWSPNGRLLSLARGPYDGGRPQAEVVVMSGQGGKPRSVLIAPRGDWEVISHKWQTVAG
jgi:Tol biopolymer transport system component